MGLFAWLLALMELGLREIAEQYELDMTTFTEAEIEVGFGRGFTVSVGDHDYYAFLNCRDADRAKGGPYYCWMCDQPWDDARIAMA